MHLSLRLLRYGSIAGCVAPAENARVVVIPESTEAPLLFAWAAGARPGLHNAEGACYRVANLPPGRYRVGVLFTAAAPVSRHGLTLYPDNLRPREFVIYGGEEYEGIDFSIAPDGPFSIGVKAPQSGRLFSFTLMPAVGDSRVVINARLSSNDVQFANLLPGGYFILVTGPEGQRGSDPPLWGRMSVNLQANLEGLEIPMRLGHSVTGLARPDGGNSSSVCGSGAKVKLVPLEGWPPNGAMAVAARADGQFSFEGLAPARYRIAAQSSNGTCREKNSEVLDLTESRGGQRVTVPLSPRGSVRGRLAGVGESVSAVFLMALEGEQAVQVLFIDSDAEFVFTDLPAGRYYIGASPAFRPSQRWAPHAGGTGAEVTLSGGQVKPVELRVPRTSEQ